MKRILTTEIDSYTVIPLIEKPVSCLITKLERGVGPFLSHTPDHKRGVGAYKEIFLGRFL